MRFHPDVLAAHAQFGGDLEDMQRKYDAASPAPSLPEDVERVVERLEEPHHMDRLDAEAAALIRTLSSQLAETRAEIEVLHTHNLAGRVEIEADRDRLAAENERLKGVVRKSLDAINATEKLADIQRGGYLRPEQEAVLHLIVEQFLDMRRAALAGKAGEA